jgi:hypothetical protein
MQFHFLIFKNQTNTNMSNENLVPRNKKPISIKIGRFFLAFFFILFSLNSSGQKTKVAIVNIIDTTLIHIHNGFTIFENKQDTFGCQLNIKQYVEDELLRLLSPKYSVSLVKIPDSYIKNRSIYNFFGVKKAVKSWILSLKGQFDYIILLEANSIKPYNSNQVFPSSGLFTRGVLSKKGASVYSSLTFTAYNISTFTPFDFWSTDMSHFAQVPDFKFADDKMRINNEMYPIIRTALTNLLDSKIELFLNRSFLQK